MWGTFLSEPLFIEDLVSHYHTNYLMKRIPIIYRNKSLMYTSCDENIPSGINLSFESLSPSKRQVGYVLLTRAPVAIYTITGIMIPLDLHVLSL